MKIVVDTNIVFSAILNPKSTINDILLNETGGFDFYAPSFLLEEMDKHRNKVMKIGGFNDRELNFVQRFVFQSISFIDVEFISLRNWTDASKLVEDVDPSDTPFVALELEMDAFVWTGDKKLREGLKRKKEAWVLSTSVMKKIRTHRK